MLKMRFLFAGHLFLSFLILLPTISSERNNHLCTPYCGNLTISYPFRLKGDPVYCGDPNYELTCEDNHAMLTLNSTMDSGNVTHRFFVRSIDYNKSTIRINNIRIQSDLCSSIPSTSFTFANVSLYDDIYEHIYDDIYEHIYDDVYVHKWLRKYGPFFLMRSKMRVMVFLTCATKIESPLYVDISSCNKAEVYPNSSVPLRPHHYVYTGGKSASDLPNSCSLGVMVMTSAPEKKEASLETVHSDLAYGFELSWIGIFCKEGYDSSCYIDGNLNVTHLPKAVSAFRGTITSVMYVVERILFVAPQLFVLYLGARCLCCSPCVASFLIYKVRKRHQNFDAVEDYLRGHNNLTPIRYFYSDIKFITRGFKEKLGQGAHGSVYKGRLKSGRDVAVKLLEQTKADGREIINEVGTIGRIHHINVVQLVGFCVQGSKRAIVYDFMPNGSLEKHIFSEEGNSDQISCEKMFEISLGIARGVEYLHRGCDMHILHFDLKPHNILLDENFIPKISDFGLAKLYPSDDSLLPLTAARGTVGYMAPELFYKNIGSVSYKADVYSFGMLLMEMVGRRKNWNEVTDHSSQTYFPLWVYDQISAGRTVVISEVSEDENALAEKMLKVALKCIQMNPKDRPSMSQAVEMLEGNVADLEIPLRPFLCTEYMPTADDQHSSNQAQLHQTDSINLVIDS